MEKKAIERALVIGYGSIGQRHARILDEELGCSVAVVSRRQVDFATVFDDLAQALDSWQPGYVVIADRTSEHYATLAELMAAGFDGRILIEKPLFSEYRHAPTGLLTRVAVAYNLRFHPLLTRLKASLAAGERVISAHVYTGQYLPFWRPGTDYTQSYSSRQAEGGGVLRDISHELDYCAWLLGPWKRLTALGGRYGALEIDTEDCFSILMETEHCPLLTIHLNYLDRTARREISVNTVDHSYRADLVNGVFEIDGEGESVPVVRDQTYRAEHQAMLGEEDSMLCTLNEGLNVLATIAAIEQANCEHRWVER